MKILNLFYHFLEWHIFCETDERSVSWFCILSSLIASQKFSELYVRAVRYSKKNNNKIQQGFFLLLLYRKPWSKFMNLALFYEKPTLSGFCPVGLVLIAAISPYHQYSTILDWGTGSTCKVYILRLQKHSEQIVLHLYIYHSVGEKKKKSWSFSLSGYMCLTTHCIIPPLSLIISFQISFKVFNLSNGTGIFYSHFLKKC